MWKRNYHLKLINIPQEYICKIIKIGQCFTKLQSTAEVIKPWLLNDFGLSHYFQQTSAVEADNWPTGARTDVSNSPKKLASPGGVVMTTRSTSADVISEETHTEAACHRLRKEQDGQCSCIQVLHSSSIPQVIVSGYSSLFLGGTRRLLDIVFARGITSG